MSDRPQNRGGVVGGIILVMLGLALLALQFTDLGGGVVVGAIGIAFLIAYFVYRQYGLLVPGGIMTGLGLGILAQDVNLGLGDGTVVLGLGLGFISISVLDALYTRQLDFARGGFWPLIPGGILTVVGITTSVQGIERYADYIRPFALIAVGAFLIYRAAAGRSAE